MTKQRNKREWIKLYLDFYFNPSKFWLDLRWEYLEQQSLNSELDNWIKPNTKLISEQPERAFRYRGRFSSFSSLSRSQITSSSIHCFSFDLYLYLPITQFSLLVAPFYFIFAFLLIFQSRCVPCSMESVRGLRCVCSTVLVLLQCPLVVVCEFRDFVLGVCGIINGFLSVILFFSSPCYLDDDDIRWVYASVIFE